MTDEAKVRAVDPPPDNEKRYPDPYGLYRRWFGLPEDAPEGTTPGSLSFDELKELWRRWFEATAGAREESTKPENDFVGGMAPLWEEMAEDISAKMLSGEALPEDPMKFFLRWYDDTSESWSKSAEEFLRKDEVLEYNSRFFETYVRSHGEHHRVSEEGLEKLRIPARSDVARVGRLVVGVENKVDRLEETFEEAVCGLEERMDRLEGKVDRLLAALEKVAAGEESVSRRPTAGEKAPGEPETSS